jgi:uncharacterized membrane protein YbhN (UPF0104 family)
MKRFLQIFGHLLVLAIFLGAAWLLYGRLKQYTFQQLCDAIVHISWWQIAAASFLTVLNYVVLVGYDWIAVRWVVGEKFPLKKIAIASFTGYAFSYNFGATLFGTSIRYRLYSAWGMPLIKILELLVILGLTFWFGVFTLAGCIFVATPFPIPEYVENLKMPFTHTFWVGVVLLAIAASYVVLSFVCRKPLRLFGWQVPVPPPKLTLYQIVIACADQLVAAAVLYSLLPSCDGGYVRILGVFMLAFVVAVITHVPGGYGVFDVLVVNFLAKEQESAILAGLIVFRIIYYWTPLLIAAVMLGYHELTMPKEEAMLESSTETNTAK